MNTLGIFSNERYINMAKENIDLFNNNIGYLSNDNPQEFSKTIINAFNNKDSMLLGNNARRIAENNLSWEILTKDLEVFYNKLGLHI